MNGIAELYLESARNRCKPRGGTFPGQRVREYAWILYSHVCKTAMIPLIHTFPLNFHHDQAIIHLYEELLCAQQLRLLIQKYFATAVGFSCDRPLHEDSVSFEITSQAFHGCRRSISPNSGQRAPRSRSRGWKNEATGRKVVKTTGGNPWDGPGWVEENGVRKGTVEKGVGAALRRKIEEGKPSQQGDSLDASRSLDISAVCLQLSVKAHACINMQLKPNF